MAGHLAIIRGQRYQTTQRRREQAPFGEGEWIEMKETSLYRDGDEVPTPAPHGAMCSRFAHRVKKDTPLYSLGYTTVCGGCIGRIRTLGEIYKVYSQERYYRNITVMEVDQKGNPISMEKPLSQLASAQIFPDEAKNQ